MMMSALTDYSDEWQADKKVPCIGSLDSLTETNQVFTRQLENVNLTEMIQFPPKMVEN